MHISTFYEGIKIYASSFNTLYKPVRNTMTTMTPLDSRGLDQFMHIFKALQEQAAEHLPNRHPELGNLIAIDGSLIDATLSMYWADYRKGARKAKVHVGFDLNRCIPRKIFFTEGKGRLS